MKFRSMLKIFDLLVKLYIYIKEADTLLLSPFLRNEA